MNLPERIKNNALLTGEATGGSVKSVYVLLFFIPLLAYLNSCYNSFHLDDFATVSHNPYIRSLENIPSFFTNPKTFSGTGDAMYRPMLLVTYALNYSIGGKNVSGYHLFNIALHTLNTVLLFLLLYQVLLVSGGKKITPSGMKITPLYASFWAAMFFGLHTVNSQAVNYISSRSVLLVAFFYLASFNLYIRSQGRPLLYALSFLLYILSVLSKEIAVTFPVMIFAYTLLFEMPRRRSAILRVVPFILLNILGLYLVSGLYGLGGIGLTQDNFFEGHGLPRSPWSNLLTQAAVLVYYLRLFIFPSGLAFIHDFTVYTTIKDPAVIFSLFTLSAGLAIGLALIRSYRVITFGILWFFIALIPETIIPLNVVVNEHRTYLPFAGFLLVPASILLYLQERRPAKVYIVSVLLTVAALVLGVNTVLRNQVWKNDITFLEDSILKAPESNMISDSLTDAYINAGETEKAILNIKRALESNSARSYPYYALGVIYLKAGEYSESVTNLRLALRLEPGDSRTVNMLGLALLNSGKAREALPMFLKAKKLRPVWDEVYYNLGLAYLELQESGEAIKNFTSSIELNPEYIEAYNNLGLAYLATGDYNMALATFEKALERRAGSLPVLNNIAIIYLETEDLKMALSVLNKISSIDPFFADGINSFGEYYLKTGEFEKALGMFEKALSQEESGVVHWNAAVAAENTGDTHVAVRHWEGFLKNSPTSPEAEKIKLHIRNLREKL